jgi:murein L,D-transpeptidase YcbB/YkuD
MTKPLVSVLILAAAFGIGCRGQGSQAGQPGTTKSDQPAAAVSVEPIVRGKTPPAYAAADPKREQLWSDLTRFYEKRKWSPAWLDDGVPTDAARAFAESVRHAGNEGLDARHYDVGLLRALPQKGGGLLGGPDVDPRQAAEADVQLTWAFLRYASDMKAGRVDPRAVDSHWVGRLREGELLQSLEGAVDEDGMRRTLAALAPTHRAYEGLKGALAQYRKVEQEGGWPTLPATLALRKGQASPQVPALRRRLALEGDLDARLAPTAAVVQPASMTTAPGASTAPAPAGALEAYDEAVAAAVKSFEERHGLPADGILDKGTVAAMNVPVAERVATLRLNLERLRWLPEKLGDRFVYVNIPAFHLQGYEGDNVTLGMKVVVGKKDTPTPIFSDEMEAVVFSPYWNIPTNILRDETAPSIRKDPGYLYDNELEVVRNGRVVEPWSVDWSNPSGVQVRQRPGRKNALGQAKFIFPNKFDVYLHDTPADSFFNRVQRTFSHGCVRVAEPRLLAEWVLRNQSAWTPERIAAAMSSGEEKHVAVRPRIPVYLAYQTAWVENGRVQFREDIYGHDARQSALLDPTARPAPPAGTRVAEKQARGTTARPEPAV